MASRNSAVINASIPIFFLGASAAAQMVASCLYLKCTPDVLIICQAFFITAGVYLLNRILDKEDKFNNFTRWMFFNKTKVRTIFWLLLAGLAIFGPVLFYVAVHKTGVAVWFGILAITGVFYSVKIIPFFTFKKGMLWFSVKDIPFLKSFFVCVSWGGSGLILAAAANHVNVLRPDILLIIITFFICTLNSTVTADARDTKGDKMRNILTIPVLFGEKGSFKFLCLVNICTVATLYAAGMYGLFSATLTIFAVACVIWTGLSIMPQYIGSLKISRTTTELLVDSHTMTTAVGLVMITLIR